MGKAKKKVTRASKSAGPLAVGDRVRVLSGDHGNGCGTVIGVGVASARVRLDSEVHEAAGSTFEFGNLTAL